MQQKIISTGSPEQCFSSLGGENVPFHPGRQQCLWLQEGKCWIIRKYWFRLNFACQKTLKETIENRKWMPSVLMQKQVATKTMSSD